MQEIGFKEYESKIFLVLLKGSALSASEIAEKANIRRTAVYEILKTFASRGFCNEIETNTILKYEIIDPKVIADKIEREIDQHNHEKVKSLKETFKEFEGLHKSEVSSENSNINIELIRGFNKQRQTKFFELVNSAKKEILFMIRLEGYISEELDSDVNEFISRGGVIKSIYEASLDFKIIKESSRQDAKLDDLLRICKRFEKTGELVKISKSELPNMTIFDKKITFINIEDKSVPRHNKADIIIKNEAFANRMIDLFNYYWQKSFSIEELDEPSESDFVFAKKSRRIKSNILSKVN